ncbi:single-strand DNA-binding protein [Knoellia remsis]|uniref:Single-strand DNA-binding protein n=1 Tax=Knoellia remsis TaxID=407159 RepID=A0A2T0TSV2_9MICO|nr:single-strand DNA-binding protein [Knoellia remsis]
MVTTSKGTTKRGTAPVEATVNRVELAGRVSGDPQERTLPSRDVLVTLRLVVARSGGGPVDTIDLACWSASTRRTALRLGDGDRVEVTGALRRRFFRTPGGAASRYEVEVSTLRRARRGN